MCEHQILVTMMELHSIMITELHYIKITKLH